MADYGIDEILTAEAPVDLLILGGFPIYVGGSVDGIVKCQQLKISASLRDIMKHDLPTFIAYISCCWIVGL